MATLDAFIDFGDAVKGGESQRKGFEKQIQMLGFSWGVENHTTIGMGGGGGAGKAALSPLQFTKAADGASPSLFQACAKGTHIPKATVTLLKAGGDEAVDFIKIELEKCYISSYQTGGSSGGDLPIDSITVSFAKGTFTYTPQTETGAKGSPLVGTWDADKVSAG